MTGTELLAAAALAGAAVSAVGTIQQGAAAANAAEFNARVAEQEAELAKATASVEEERLRARNRALLASQIAATAKSGLGLAGSPLAVMAETAGQAELDALSVRFAGSTKEAFRRSEASIARFEGKQLQSGSFFTAGATILSGAAKAGQIKLLGDE